ncbi:hypothetical protein ATR1_302d0001, partial [Acetobacter tropicalis]|uniref:hypothetical protein n=1 Tax=Acetobacter tropicalis TaxID=104102 RepID=UPI0005B1607D
PRRVSQPLLPAYTVVSGRIGYRLQGPLQPHLGYYESSVTILVSKLTNLGDPAFPTTQVVAFRFRIQSLTTLAGQVSETSGETV